MNQSNLAALSAATRAVADDVLSNRPEAVDGGAAAVLFYEASAFDFALAWQAVDPTNRWMFPIQSEGPPFVYYVCLRLHQLGYAIGQILFATAGQGALFYLTLTSASANSSGVVGLLPGNTPVHDFGSTLGTLAPDAAVTLICDLTAADNDYQGTLYKGIDLVGPLASYVNGKVVASDQTIVRNQDGTATTVGNVWVGDPQTGVATILCPAPGGGALQSFPLANPPVCG